MYTTPHCQPTSKKRGCVEYKLTVWNIPLLAQPQIDPLFRFRMQKQFEKYFGIPTGQEMEEFFAYNCLYKPDIYQEHAMKLMNAMKNMDIELLRKYGGNRPDNINNSAAAAAEYDPLTFVCMDESILFPNAPYEQEYKERLLRSKTSEKLIQELTKDSEDHISIKCRTCGSRAEFNAVQIKSADEPMTIFANCTNKDCNTRWRWN